MKLCLNLIAATALTGLTGAAPGWAQANVGVQTVDVMNGLWGKHAGMRANHAKGEVVEGVFQATSEAAKLSKASIFNGEPVRCWFGSPTRPGCPTFPTWTRTRRHTGWASNSS